MHPGKLHIHDLKDATGFRFEVRRIFHDMPSQHPVRDVTENRCLVIPVYPKSDHVAAQICTGDLAEGFSSLQAL